MNKRLIIWRLPSNLMDIINKQVKVLLKKYLDALYYETFLLNHLAHAQFNQ
jgi:hypothetical protein